MLLLLLVSLPPLDVENCAQYSDHPDRGTNIFVYLFFYWMWFAGACSYLFPSWCNVEQRFGRFCWSSSAESAATAAGAVAHPFSAW